MKAASLTTLIAVAMLAACEEPGTILGPDAPNPRLSVSAAAAADATPVVVYSNFGPGKTFNPIVSAGWAINGFTNPQTGQQAISQRFTPSSNGRFLSAEVVVLVIFGPPSMRVVLQADANGLPGQVLEDIPLQGLQQFATLITAASTVRPSLRMGTPYWLTVIAGDVGVIGGWNTNSIGDVSAGNFAVTGSGSPLGPWSAVWGLQRTVFQVNAAPPTAQDAIQLLMEQVSGLVAGGTLNLGQGNALLVKLSAALESLGRDNARAACGQLDAIMNQTRALVDTGRLSASQGTPLLDLALQASSRLGCA
jgi:hypothetical protein